jgi:Flp pilus assembly protein TadG
VIWRRRKINPLAQISGDQRGSTLVEFGLIAPSLILMMCGALEIGHTLYMQAVLQGVVQKAARDGSLETATGTSSASRDALDEKVRTQVLRLHANASVTFNRRFYRTFSLASAAQAESFTDTNTNGLCDNGEPFTDTNNNGVRDADGGDSANRAGARDNIVYTVSMSYPRIFPVDRFVGGNGSTNLRAATVLSNQPFGKQASYGAATVGNCP